MILTLLLSDSSICSDLPFVHLDGRCQGRMSGHGTGVHVLDTVVIGHHVYKPYKLQSMTSPSHVRRYQ